MEKKKIIYPEALEKGDKIAIVSPASSVKEEYVYGAMQKIRDRGYEPVLMPHAIGHEYGSYAAPERERVNDIIMALEDREIKAILCSRGGYGCCQLLRDIPLHLIKENPKWIIGFSDVTALHALWLKAGVASIHGPMAKHISTSEEDDYWTVALFNVLENGGRMNFVYECDIYDIPGAATGRLRGGNMAVMNDLAGSPYDMFNISPEENPEGVILFLEDIGEPIYKVNRMLWRLLLSGVFDKIKGLIFGNFTNYQADKNYKAMEEMISDFCLRYLKHLDIPIAIKFPTGHVPWNNSLVEGALINLDTTNCFVNLNSI